MRIAAILVCADVVLTAQHTSVLRRPGASRVLEAWEIDPSCNFTFSTYQQPEIDYFHGAACESQIHISLHSSRSASISYVSTSTRTSSRIRYGTRLDRLDSVAWGSAMSYTSLMSVDTYLYDPPMDEAFATVQEVNDVVNTTAWAKPGSSSRYIPKTTPSGLLQYKNPGAIYSSPIVHTVVLDDLVPGQRYYYSVPRSVEALAKVRSFVFPKSGFPLLFGLTADVGQTVVSNRTFDALVDMSPDAVLLAGDLSYADGWPFRWDTFGKLAEKLAARVPVMVTGGNHEIGSSENWQHFTQRWSTPYASSFSTSPLYWSIDIGPVHVIALNSYDNFVQNGDRLQREWLLDDLASVDRTTTPWLVVFMHVPFYTSNCAHPGEGELMRLAYEPILFAAGVDIVLSGHVHAYERSTDEGVYDSRPDPCGPLYLGIGDGGNRENVAAKWAKPQPDWSAFRESSFGVGRLEFVDESRATYEWRRHACGGNDKSYDLDPDCRTRGDDSRNHVAVDAFNIVRQRDLYACVDQRRSVSTAIKLPADIRRQRRGTDTGSRTSSSCRKTGVSVVLAIFFALSSFGLGAAAGACCRCPAHATTKATGVYTCFFLRRSQYRRMTAYAELPTLSRGSLYHAVSTAEPAVLGDLDATLA